MMKKIIFIIGFVLCFPAAGWAAGMPDYCQPPQDQSQPPIPGEKLYRGIYCDTAKGMNEDEAFESTADLMGFKKSSTVKAILEGEIPKPEDMPEILNKKYKDLKENDRKIAIYQDVKKVHARERQLLRWRAELEPQLKSKEVWANGTTLDSPFDLITDLNLAEIVLFGSNAVWTNDIYKFPPEEGKETAAESAGGSEGGTGNLPTEEGVPPPEEFPPPEEPGDLTCISPENPNASTENPQGGTQDGTNNNNPQIPGEPEPVCRDPEALTLRKYAVQTGGGGTGGASGGGAGGEGQLPLDCPPGTYATYVRPETPPLTPVEILTGQAPVASSLKGRVAGGLKPLKKAPKPVCPAGSTKLTVSSFGKEKDICVPVSAQGCALDFEKIKGKLGEGAIEAAFCAKVSTVNRPASEYGITEGCIDCHVSGMIDVLETLRNQNISPLENTKNAFALSNRWGPKLSFDLKIYIKNKLEPFSWGVDADYSPVANIDKDLKEAKIDCKPARYSANDTPEQKKIIDDYNKKCEAEQEKKAEVLKALKTTQEIQNDATFSEHITPMLLHMKSTFESIRNQFVGMGAIEEKNKCKCN
jgi:hypothetical protein